MWDGFRPIQTVIFTADEAVSSLRHALFKREKDSSDSTSWMVFQDEERLYDFVRFM